MLPLAKPGHHQQPIAPPAKERADRPDDDVELTSEESFPASDPPSWTPVSRVGSPRPITPPPGAIIGR